MRKLNKIIALLLSVIMAVSISSFAVTADDSDITTYKNVPIYVDGLLSSRGFVIDGTTYVPVSDMACIMGLEGKDTTDTDTGVTEFKAGDFTVSYDPEDNYVLANGRYLMVDKGIVEIINEKAMYPISLMKKIFGYDISWNAEDFQVIVSTEDAEVIESGDTFYSKYDFGELARLVFAEAGNQPFAGMVGVANVVLNRVKSSRFPNDVHSVIYASGQFDPVASGSINNTASEDACLAAHFAIEGYDTVYDSLFFQNPSASGQSWSNLTYVCTIGDHVFYK